MEIDGVRLIYSGRTVNQNYNFVGINYPDGAYTEDNVEVVTPGGSKIVNVNEFAHIAGTNKYMRWLYATDDAVSLLVTDAVPIPESWYSNTYYMERFWQIISLLFKPTVQAANVDVGSRFPIMPFIHRW